MFIKSLLKKYVKKIYQRYFKRYFSALDELLWAQSFHDAINGSEWVVRKNFAPGRAAVGYEFLYVLFRALNSARPKSILELGLGQTTHMITQYVSANPDAKHVVVEHDPSWVEFFLENHIISDRTKIVGLELEKADFHGAGVTSYKGFLERFKSDKFDFICIDGPFGFDAKKYSRVDVLRIVPDCLENSFVIMIDDYDRMAEQNTVGELAKILSENGILTGSGSYQGRKTTHIIVTRDHEFLCTL
jgi:hypothetical protein